MLVLLVPLAFAQLPWEVTDLRCGNGVLDQFELCENKVEESKCGEIGKLLSIAMACDWQHCTCVPRVISTYCGNNRRETMEVCDGKGEDLCPQL